ncbi:ribonuclease H-like protein [Meira miltonrushii]|uniref:Ribonuclease H-like protein n=1 Tax=Meira miltonrushii TaxID=1280837 RepID=A0A316VHX9_9BASI|nr:ribonuclease H-like protein [Meira miltonrushii]PWN36854.1 ribonuclease H-like protein [Meira miltonrushii]
MSSSQHAISPIPPPAANRKLEAKDGALVWIDCEMTGLDVESERIIEIACIITDGQLNPLDEGVNYVIRTEKEVLDKMNDWCIRQHGHSGLTKACLDPEKSFQHADVRAAILAYVRDRIPLPYHACLAGSTVHADAKFLHKEMPELMSHLHYRIVDVSSIKELVSRWYGEDKRWTGGKGNHRALDDIKGSIEELKHYRKRFFTKQ